MCWLPVAPTREGPTGRQHMWCIRSDYIVFGSTLRASGSMKLLVICNFLLILWIFDLLVGLRLPTLKFLLDIYHSYNRSIRPCWIRKTRWQNSKSCRTCRKSTILSDAKSRKKSKNVSQLLKVVETWFWAQNDRNSRVYISTYNKPKL